LGGDHGRVRPSSGGSIDLAIGAALVSAIVLAAVLGEWLFGWSRYV